MKTEIHKHPGAVRTFAFKCATMMRHRIPAIATLGLMLGLAGQVQATIVAGQVAYERKPG